MLWWVCRLFVLVFVYLFVVTGCSCCVWVWFVGVIDCVACGCCWISFSFVWLVFSCVWVNSVLDAWDLVWVWCFVYFVLFDCFCWLRNWFDLGVWFCLFCFDFRFGFIYSFPWVCFVYGFVAYCVNFWVLNWPFGWVEFSCELWVFGWSFLEILFWNLLFLDCVVCGTVMWGLV